jgi:MoCo/4Fe-4S cofactor protein with predicted Tat translocation signal
MNEILPPPTVENDAAVPSARLATDDGQRLWRSLEEWADSEAFREFLDREFPEWASLLETPVQRRRMLQLMAASLLLGGLGGCGRQPKEEIVPYVRSPEESVPGQPLYFATALTHGGYAQSVVVESHQGRPTKVEGNEKHPASLGATDVFAQAAVLGLYDPNRSQTLTNGGEIATWEAFVKDISRQRGGWAARRGAGVYILTETVTSPTLGRQLDDFFRAYPEARWHRHEPAGRDNVRVGARLAFGQDADTLYRFDQAAVILSLDSDFLTETPARTRYGHDFIEGRRIFPHPNPSPTGRGALPSSPAGRRAGDEGIMNRLYAIESTPTLTGAMADHRLPLRAGRMEILARALAGKLGLAGLHQGGGELPVPEPWLDAVARDLAAHRGASLIVAGEHLSPAVQALVQAMNERLGNFGATVMHIDPVDLGPADERSSLAALADEMRTGRVQTLLILGGNPVYTAPVDLDFAALLRRAPLRIHHGLYADETAALCHWHIPALHELESWTDAKAYDGTVALIQPLIAPLYGGRSAHELLALLLGQVGRSDHDVLQAYWRSRHTGPDFDPFWRSALRDGLVPNTAHPPRTLAVRSDLAGTLPPPLPVSAPDHLEIRFRPDPSVWDGRYANNGWLQELPKPLTKLTWENAVLLAPKTAARLGVRNGESIELNYRDRRLTAPVWIMPGHADDSATLHLGYGRERAGRVGSHTGFNAYRLRTSAAPWFDDGLIIRRLEPRRDWLGLGFWADAAEPPTTQHHHALDGRDLVRVRTPATLAAAPETPPAEPKPSLYPEHRYEGYAWAMVVDLNACIGCNACVVACQAENNIPIVGKEEVRRGREMHWLRVDRYYAGPPENPKTYFQPVPCMHCERAPCEPVCPVQASIHDSEGLNNQVYNRCVGTRFCQSNCPYKVRRFNFFGYSANPDTNEGAPITAAVRNPDVTVRSRGVMEKCTYCIQRISRARIRSQEENRRIRDGEVRTACQQACPTQAIVFGDLNTPGSQVNALKAQPHHYALLEELNTQPRTTYLARLRNPNPELDQDEQGNPV